MLAYDLYRQPTSVQASSLVTSSESSRTIAGSTPARAVALRFLLFSSYSLVFIVMRLIQFNVYFNHHFHIFILSYITKYSF